MSFGLWVCISSIIIIWFFFNTLDAAVKMEVGSRSIGLARGKHCSAGTSLLDKNVFFCFIKRWCDEIEGRSAWTYSRGQGHVLSLHGHLVKFLQQARDFVDDDPGLVLCHCEENTARTSCRCCWDRKPQWHYDERSWTETCCALTYWRLTSRRSVRWSMGGQKNRWACLHSADVDWSRWWSSTDQWLSRGDIFVFCQC